LFVKFDQKFNKDPGYVFYDFNKPEDIPADLHKTFDMIVIDPPFITREVWEKVKQTNLNNNIVC
jgi:16S rRNA G966 N2-methylase RsmD